MSRRTSLIDLKVDELVDQYASFALAQNAAEKRGRIAEFNRLAKRMNPISQELTNRPGGQRLALLRLYDHSDMQVRFSAARDTGVLLR